MDIIIPSYYPDFECIADRCRHSCCVGWEIDIDEDTAEYYREVEGEIGERLRDRIKCEDGTYSFALDERERCPFLAENGLCDIICSLGEEALCQICADHPRFKNHLSDCTEVGLGLCCEEAARLIHTYSEPFELYSCEGGGCTLTPFEEWKLTRRHEYFDILTDRTLPVEERISHLDISEADAEALIPFYRTLERLDHEWDICLDRYSSYKVNIPETAKEQLLNYFIYRYPVNAEDEEDFYAYMRFALLSYRMIIGVCEDSIEGLLEAARMYSSEIEYSTDNVDEIINKLTLCE